MRFDRIAYLRLNCLFSPQFLSENRFTLDPRIALIHAHAPHLRLAIVLILSTTARATALLELTWDRVDFKCRQIHLRNPDDTGRRKGRAVVPINNSLNEALYEAYQAAQSDYVLEWQGRTHKAFLRWIEYREPDVRALRM